MKLLILLLLALPVSELRLNRETKQLAINETKYSIVENPSYLIHTGTYKIILTYSNKLKQITPEILVPGREGIRIHVVKSLNAGYALLGCVGMLREDYDKLFETIKADKDLSIVVG